MIITDFLLARIAEDEALAHNVTIFKVNPATGLPGNQSIKARVLAECAAKRAIIRKFRVYEAYSRERGHSQDHLDAMWHNALVVRENLRALASVYRDHEDYDPEWAA